jgi:hypothetical protein
MHSAVHTSRDKRNSSSHPTQVFPISFFLNQLPIRLAAVSLPPRTHQTHPRLHSHIIKVRGSTAASRSAYPTPCQPRQLALEPCHFREVARSPRGQLPDILLAGSRICPPAGEHQRIIPHEGICPSNCAQSLHTECASHQQRRNSRFIDRRYFFDSLIADRFGLHHP